MRENTVERGLSGRVRLETEPSALARSCGMTLPGPRGQPERASEDGHCGCPERCGGTLHIRADSCALPALHRCPSPRARCIPSFPSQVLLDDIPPLGLFLVYLVRDTFYFASFIHTYIKFSIPLVCSGLSCVSEGCLISNTVNYQNGELDHN